ncbi:50S ribosomal protein L17 [Cardinium endosymbiont of Oedothorax gibbosus]|uniref:50S ribosomal protein L17 n=1 Tax=Cardinium endosymbiont of Oedothorax gibbosus TaxID=931101 RepID=UPI00202540AE|nr:50S ribosomal protein L17 [Cardinium endosymbiont of Oedothorax gibbosus]CAH2559742.1 50S ribosomal protein L17 [Cardinium endosymbiont of Oedothorax gibbosus]
MRHRNKINRLGRPAGHRKALLMNLSKSLIMHKRIVTTLAKGKALRAFIEPILTRAKQDTTHSRRIVFSHFQDKEPVKELFNHIAEKIDQRPGGYTRIVKLANRAGDNAAMCMIELVDYNDIYTKETKFIKTTRRRRKKSTSSVVSEVVAEIDSDKKEVE